MDLVKMKINNRFEKLYPWLIASFTVFLSFQWSPLFREIETDSGVFLYIGKLMLNGGLPYRDAWDHKPPLIYMFNCIGLWLGNGRWGIWSLETFLLASTSSLLFYKLIKIFNYPKALFIFLIFTLLFSRSNLYFCGGNYCESYALPLEFLCISFIGDGWPFWVLIGVICGLLIFLKYTLITFPISIVLAVIFWNVYKKKHNKNYLFLVIGTISTICLILFLVNKAGILGDWYDQTVVYNKIYASYQLKGASPLRKLWELARSWESFGLINTQIIMLGISGLYIFAMRNKMNFEKGILALSTFINIVLQIVTLTSTGNLREHYLLPLFIHFPISLCLLTDLFNEDYFVFGKIGSEKLWTISIILFLFTTPVLTCGLGTFANAVHPMMRGEDQEVLNELNQYDKSTMLLMWGDDVKWNFISGLKSPSKYVYYFPLCPRSYGHEKKFKEFLDDLKREKKIVIVDEKTNCANNLRGECESKSYGDLRVLPLASMQKMREFIRENFRLAKTFENNWDLYEKIEK